jgi:NDP-sugar pyrophosphorylase family protein/lipopolysaccharide/colanic/teichoic acid biosynthesis glycosyltransferase
MRAVIIATGHRKASEAIELRQIAPLMQCVDRPALQHTIEVLVEHGITHFDLILHESPEQVEALLGDGKRWGSSFNFQLARVAEQPYRILKLLEAGDGVLLVHADSLPVLPVEQFAPGRSVMFCTEVENGAPKWTGWARLNADVIAQIPADADRAELERVLFSELRNEGIQPVPQCLDLGTLRGLLAAQRSILTNTLAGVHLSARQNEPGVWIARNVVIHPTAMLSAPLFIGENARIGAGSRIGPNAVIGHDTVIDRHTSVVDAMVQPGSFCGEGLELDHVFVDRNRLINIGLNTEVQISDSFILGSLKGSIGRGWTSHWASRLIAAVSVMLTFPLLAAVWLARRDAFHRREVVRLPAQGAAETWTVFPVYSFRRFDDRADGKLWRRILFDMLPNLAQIARGRMGFVGVEPRSPEQIGHLPEDWRALYLQSRAGLITEAGVLYGADATEDDVYSSEVYYSAMAGPRHDFALAVQFLARAVRNA